MEMERGERNSLLIDIVALIGEDKANLLFYARGGEQVYIPAVPSLTADHWLVKAVGLEAASALSTAYQGLHLILPLSGKGLFSAIKKRANSAIQEGMSNNEIVRSTGLSIRTITRFRRRLEADDGQPKRRKSIPLF
jgi:hypothetical protein